MIVLHAVGRFLSWLFRPEFHPRCAYTRGYYSALSQQELDVYPGPNPFLPGSEDFRDWNAGFAEGLSEAMSQGDS